MSLPRGPGAHPPVRVAPMRAPKGPVLAVGSRVIVPGPPPRGPGIQPPVRVAPMRAPKGPVLAVGSRVIVTGPPAGNGRAVLTDHDLVTARATVPNGAEVEILAWHPSGATGTRYRVISVRDGVEGWIGATCLKPAERPRVREATGLTAPPAAVAPRRPTPVPSRVAPRPVTAVRTETVTTKAVARPGKKAKAKRG